jgi:hypothetical protein
MHSNGIILLDCRSLAFAAFGQNANIYQWPHTIKLPIFGSDNLLMDCQYLAAAACCLIANI